MTGTEAWVVLALVGLPVIGLVGAMHATYPHPATEHTTPALSPWAIVAALILPVVGVIIAIVLLAHGRGAHGAAVLLTSIVGAFLAAALVL